MKTLILDYETRSHADLKKVGAYKYAADPTTEILCIGYKLDDAPTEVIRRATPGFLALLNDPETTIVAHNAFFERMVTRFCLGVTVPISRWICTASLASALALPRNLEGACAALKLPVQKDMDGRRLLLKLCKPRKATKYTPAGFFESPEDIERLMQYCATDVDAEYHLFKSVPALIPTEREVWELDQLINERGFFTDAALVKAALCMIESEMSALDSRANRSTLGTARTAAQRNEFLDWLRIDGADLPDLKVGTVKEALAGELSPEARDLLEVRALSSKSSTAKYKAFAARASADNRVRDIMLYHGASTGRWTGTGVQPQNFPRGSIKDTAQAAQIISEGDLELTRLIYGSPLEALSSTLRAVITATPGFELFCEDYAAIEARVLLWIAGDIPGLQVFENGLDPYKIMAGKIFRKSPEDITKPEREMGKRAELGAGYGMGAKKFKETCHAFGDKTVDDDLAKTAILAYREAHPAVVKCWSNLERAAVFAVKNYPKKARINKTLWFLEGGFLFCELPSGRRLAYYQPEVRAVATPWGAEAEKLFHYGVNPVTRKWALEGTYGGRLVENVVQAVARDIMAEAMLRVERAGYRVLLSVHDEILAEKEKGQGSYAEFQNLMRMVPAWAAGCPIKTEGFTGLRYRK